MVPRIDNLSIENWQRNPDPQFHLQALKDLETALAAQEHREACDVQSMSAAESQSPMGTGSDEGRQKGDQIFINEALLNKETPYRATEILFHEARHAYQEHVVAHPELAESPQQAQDWKMGLAEPEKAMYLAPFHPTEKDAREVARQRTDEMYLDHFDDREQYADYRLDTIERSIKDREDGSRIHLYRDTNGNELEQLAYQRMVDNYQKNHPEASQATANTPHEGTEASQPAAAQGEAAPGVDRGDGLEQAPAAGDAASQAATGANLQSAPQEAEQAGASGASEGESADQDYSYGYGM